MELFGFTVKSAFLCPVIPEMGYVYGERSPRCQMFRLLV